MRVEASDSYSARPVDAGILLAEVREPAAGRVDLLVEHRDAEVEFLTDGLALARAGRGDRRLELAAGRLRVERGLRDPVAVLVAHHESAPGLTKG